MVNSHDNNALSQLITHEDTLKKEIHIHTHKQNALFFCQPLITAGKQSSFLSPEIARMIQMEV